jgi:23S rRNA (uracil1939-C5)-methyltransferase
MEDRQPKEYIVQFEKHAYGGESMGRLPDGRAVFAAYVLPGETASIEIIWEKKGFAKAVVKEILKPASQRITPRCHHFGVCGGCSYQNLNYSDQLQVKHDLVVDQLERIGGFQTPTVKPVLASEQPFYYRNAIQFHMDTEGRLGFLAAGSSVVVPIQECFLPMEGIFGLWKQLDMEPFPGLQRVHLREGMDDDLLVVFESENYQDLPTLEIELPISAVHLSPAGSLVMAGDDHLVMQIQEKYFRVSADSFFQVNNLQASVMVEKVLAYLSPFGGHLLELYCGVGLFTAFLADKYETITAVEASESACADFAVNLDAYDHISLYMSAVEDVLPGLDVKADAVLVDPPRSGLERRALDAIAVTQAKKVVYVSCDPATFARDAKRLAGNGYRLVEVTPLDMFPQTQHVECVALFIRDLSVK